MRKEILITGLCLLITIGGCTTQNNGIETNKSSQDSVTSDSEMITEQVTSETVIEVESEIIHDLNYKDLTDNSITINLPIDTKLINEYDGEVVFGNANLSSLVTADDEWIYYRNPDEYGHLYKIDQYGNNKTLLVEKKAVHGLYVIEDTIYFACYEKGEKGSIMSVYSANKNGSKLEKLFEGKGDDIVVTQNFIYYSSYPEPDFCLHRYNIKTKEIEQLNSSYSKSFNIVNSQLFYNASFDYINVYDLKNGTDSVFYSPGGTISQLQYSKEEIYFSRGKDIHKLNVLNDKEETIFKGSDKLWTKELIVTEEYVFFIGYSYDDENSKEANDLYRINADSSNFVKIKSNVYGPFYIIGDKIFLYNSYDTKPNNYIQVIDFEGNLIDFDM